MDLNRLLQCHQRALFDTGRSASPERRRWASLSAVFYADQIARLRSSLGREDPFTWSFDRGGIIDCG